LRIRWNFKVEKVAQKWLSFRENSSVTNGNVRKSEHGCDDPYNQMFLQRSPKPTTFDMIRGGLADIVREH
jgi:hypothetical protein